MNLINDDFKKKSMNQLIDFLRIKSISADKSFKNEILKASKWVKNSLDEIGCQNTRIYETKGNPIVYGEVKLSSNYPTVLIYGHYDVQPPDPLNLWDSPPFDPVVKTTSIHREGAIFARGASDDKGQMFSHIKAVELLKINDSLNCNVKFLIEGEEEIGSENLEEFITKNTNLLKNDVILISDTSIESNSKPCITTGLRGLSYMEIELIGPSRDLHSGVYGGAVPNPLNTIVEILSKLHDEDKKISIPGFYDNVKLYSDKERIELKKNSSQDGELFKKDIDIIDYEGEKQYDYDERISIRPSLDINGIWGGYQGEGAKTVIPSKAYAKVSMRLVPNQDWNRISDLFKNYIKSITPKNILVNIKTHHGGLPYFSDTSSKEYKAAYMAYKDAYGIAPFSKKEGASIPIVPIIEKLLKSKVILMGFGLNSDSIHSPNEHYGIFNFFKGIETICNFYKYFPKN